MSGRKCLKKMQKKTTNNSKTKNCMGPKYQIQITQFYKWLNSKKTISARGFYPSSSHCFDIGMDSDDPFGIFKLFLLDIFITEISS